MTTDECLEALRSHLRQVSLRVPAVCLALGRLRWHQAEAWRLSRVGKRFSGEDLCRAESEHRAAIEAILADYLDHERLLPYCKDRSVLPWVACAICGEHPATYNPLPGGWVWDSDDPTDCWVWCPAHRHLT